VRDGYEAHALLPLPEKRGLVLIDPPFERNDELDAIAALIGKAAPRFAGGVFAAWYPIKNRHRAARFARRVAKDAGKPVLNLMFDNGAEADDEMHFATRGRPQGATPAADLHRSRAPRRQDAPTAVRVVEKVPMHACGLLVVNPPFGFEPAALAALQWLKPRLAQGPHAGVSVNYGEEDA
jgi:23S rRNA (adenine2030-N6)-methyltransferase